jgi:predicted nucleic acid-binding protein
MTVIGRGPVALDSSVFIYWIEEHPKFEPVLAPLFGALGDGHLAAVTSAISLLETLVVPLRSGQTELTSRYETFLSRGPGLTLHPIDVPLLRAAAVLRARSRVGTPDALQLATAIAAGCTSFVTNDRRIPEVPGLKVIQLEQVA